MYEREEEEEDGVCGRGAEGVEVHELLGARGAVAEVVDAEGAEEGDRDGEGLRQGEGVRLR